MIDQEKLKTAKTWMNALANGYNPLDGSTLEESDIVNNVHISRCLFYVCELLDYVGNSTQNKVRKSEFRLDPEDIPKVCLFERTGISMLVGEINKVIPENMKPLSASAVTNWLVRIGYLQETFLDDGRKVKVPTELGKSVGISSEQRIGPQGPYIAVVYSTEAQQFILENLFNE